MSVKPQQETQLLPKLKLDGLPSAGVLSARSATQTSPPAQQQSRTDQSLRWTRVVHFEPASFHVRPRFGHSAVVMGKYILYYGGVVEENELIGDLEMYDTELNLWSEFELASDSIRPTPRCFHSATLVDDKMIVFGGSAVNERCTQGDPLRKFSDILVCML